MGFLSKLLLLPVRGPADGVFWIATRIAEQAEFERNSPHALRAALAEAERMLVEGTLAEEEYDRIEDDLLDRLARAGGGR